MNILKRFKSWRKRRADEKFMKDNYFPLIWGTVSKDEKGNFVTTENDSYGPWVKGEMIDITGNKDIAPLKTFDEALDYLYENFNSGLERLAEFENKQKENKS